MRMRLAAGIGLGFLISTSSLARGDDFGKLLRKATGDSLQKSLSGQGVMAPRSGHGPAAKVETHAIKTKDGWTLVAHRYPPTGPAQPGRLPVILCHGLTYNAQFWNLDPACNFAEYLSGMGYDVWAVDLRGSGLSQKWVWKVDDAPDMVVDSALRRLSKGKLGSGGYATVDPRFANWSLDHHIAYDVPALVGMVRQKTGATEVAWVGHSMGGIIAIAHLARYPNPGIGRLATIGSQVTMSNTQLPASFLTEMLMTREKQVAGQLRGSELMDQSKTSVHNMFFNMDHVQPSVYEALGGWATDVPSVGVMRQYMTLSTKGELLDSRGQFNYARALSNITIPIFISCGALDNFAPPIVQKYLYDHVGSTDKTVVLFGKIGGFKVDAGHDDALVGLSSKAEVYPVIEKWLRGGR